MLYFWYLHQHPCYRLILIQTTIVICSTKDVFFLSRRNFVEIYAMANCASESGTILEQINKDVTKSFFDMRCHQTLSIDHFVYKYETLNQ